MDGPRSSCVENRGEYWLGWTVALAQWSYTAGLGMTVLLPRVLPYNLLTQRHIMSVGVVRAPPLPRRARSDSVVMHSPAAAALVYGLLEYYGRTLLSNSSVCFVICNRSSGASPSASSLWWRWPAAAPSRRAGRARWSCSARAWSARPGCIAASHHRSSTA
jgi:hypothetical protein